MKARLIDKSGLQRMLDRLGSEGYEVVAPRLENGIVEAGPVTSLDELPARVEEETEAGEYRLRPADSDRMAPLFSHTLTATGWQRFLHPFSEPLWRAERRDGGMEIQPLEAAAPKRALIGLRACDLAAISIQDRVLEQNDPRYVRRRENLFLVAVNCSRATATCFCRSMGSGPEVKQGHDLMLTELVSGGAHRFLVEAGSRAGEELLQALPGREPERGDWEEKEAQIEAASRQRRRLPENSETLLARSLDHPHWEEVGERCLACGNCTLVCPTCFCSRMVERTTLDGRQATHWRLRDSCFDSEHSYLHGGPVRRDRAARYRQWLTHKLYHWQAQFGTPGCTGCGRCITWCPVGIDLTEEVAILEAVA